MIILKLLLRRRYGEIKKIEDKRKLRSNKEVINPNREYQKYIFVLTSIKENKNC